ncbi:MAG: hypothetical protein RR501_10480, partial [Cloacibacillus sp.]
MAAKKKRAKTEVSTLFLFDMAALLDRSPSNGPWASISAKIMFFAIMHSIRKINKYAIFIDKKFTK